MRCGLLGRVTGGDPLTGLLSAVQSCSAPDGASQSGKIVKVFLHGRQIPRRTQMRFVLVIVALAESPSVADDRVASGRLDIAAAGGPTGSPRVDVVFRLWQCDKKNHGWREGRR